MSGWELGVLWVAWVLAGASPGPATISIAGTSMNQGRRAGFFMAAGIIAGSATWGIAAALGVSALLVAHIWVFNALKYIGAIYLLFLAYKSMKSALSTKEAIPLKGASGTDAQVFLKGYLIHLTNPKAILAWGAIYTVALPSDAGILQVFRLFALLFSGSLLVFPSYAILFSTEKVVLDYQRLRRGFETTFALLFGTASLKILLMEGLE